MNDAVVLRHIADLQAARLTPDGVAPEFLAEAIWVRSLLGTSPTDDEVRVYLSRCRRLGVPISGREEHQAAIHPAEQYRCPDGTVFELVRVRRGDYRLLVVGTEALVCLARTRTSAHARAQREQPGGVWSASLSLAQRVCVRDQWGIS